MRRGAHVLHHWSRTQTVVSLSSGEAELNAVLKGASEIMMVSSLMKEMDVELQCRVHTDSGACVGICDRAGSGRIKHLEVRQLWVQEKMAEGRIRVVKVPRLKNPADLMTHHWTRREGEMHMELLGAEWRQYDAQLDPSQYK